MSARAITPHCAWAIAAVRARQLPPLLRWLIVTIAERVDRNTLQWWSSIAAMMSDTGLSRRQVQYLIRDLPPDLIQVRRGAGGRWVFTLLRPAVETSDGEAAELVKGAHCAPPDPPRGARCAPYPLKQESPEEKEEREPPASPPAPAPSSSPVSFSSAWQESRIEEVPAAAPEPPRERATRLPDDWQPSPEVCEMAREAGWENPEDDLRDAIFRWERSQPTPPVRPWNAFAVRWIGLEPKFRPGRAVASGKRDWRAENADFIAETDRLLHVPDGWTYAGVAP